MLHQLNLKQESSTLTIKIIDGASMILINGILLLLVVLHQLLLVLPVLQLVQLVPQLQPAVLQLLLLVHPAQLVPQQRCSIIKI